MLCHRNFLFPMSTIDVDNDFGPLFSIVRDLPDRPPHSRPNYRVRPTAHGTDVDIELPGVNPDDIDIEVKDRLLTVSAKRFSEHVSTPSQEDSQPQDKPTENQEPSDSQQGGDRQPTQQADATAPRSTRTTRMRYTLRLTMDPDVDTANIECKSYNQGVLSLHAPRRAQQQPRKISVN